MSISRVLPILALVAAFAAPSAAVADTTAAPVPAASGAPLTRHHRHHHQSLMHALQSLNLSAAQKQQVATFHSQEQQANANADSATRRANAAKMRGQIMGILTPDQQTQLDAQMHHGHGGSPAPNGAAPAPNGAAPSPVASPPGR